MSDNVLSSIREAFAPVPSATAEPSREGDGDGASFGDVFDAELAGQDSDESAEGPPSEAGEVDPLALALAVVA